MCKKMTMSVLVLLLCCAQTVPSFAADAAANFKKICVACHGADRKGKAAMVKLYKVAPAAMDLTSKEALSRSDADLTAIISGGKGKMPAHKDKLTPEEITELVSYLKTAGAPSGTKTAGQPAPKAAASADFKACVSCHGKDGKGNPGMAKMFKVAPSALDLTGAGVREKKDEDLSKIILEGKGKMPAYKGKLNEAQLKELLKFLKTLAPQKKP